MKNNSQHGFSILELLIVVVIIGIIAGISVALYQRAVMAAENRSAVAHLSLLRSAQANFYAQRHRYGRFDELNATMYGSASKTMGDVINANELRRGKFTFLLVPLNPTDNELRINYRIVATRVSDTPVPFVYDLDSTGVIVGINEL